MRIPWDGTHGARLVCLALASVPKLPVEPSRLRRGLSHPGHSGTAKQRELRSSVKGRRLRKQLGLNDFR